MMAAEKAAWKALGVHVGAGMQLFTLGVMRRARPPGERGAFTDSVTAASVPSHVVCWMLEGPGSLKLALLCGGGPTLGRQRQMQVDL